MNVLPTAAADAPGDLAGVRVLVITSGHEALDGRVYAREASGLERLGADVTVVGKWTTGTPGRVPVLAVPPPSSRPARFLIQPWRCLWKARKLRPDIVHFHDAEMLAVLPVARLLWRKARFVYDVHEDFANLMLVRDWLPRPVKPLVRALTAGFEGVLARLAHGIVAVTPPLAERFPHSSKAIAYNFAPETFFEEAVRRARKPREREFDVVHLGTLSVRRAEFLAAVLRSLRAIRPTARALIVGAEDDVLQRIASRLPAGCEVLGKVAHEEVPALLGNARVGLDVHPWLSPHLLPAFAVKVGEYMACGCAIVASAMPVLDELLAGSGLEPDALARIPGGEPEDYARSVDRMLVSIEAGADPGAAARAFARRRMGFAGEAVKIGRLYRSLLENAS